MNNDFNDLYDSENDINTIYSTRANKELVSVVDVWQLQAVQDFLWLKTGIRFIIMRHKMNRNLKG